MALIAPIEPAAWPETLADIRRRMGTPLNVHRVLASYPAWLHAWFPFRNHVVHGTSLSSRQYELVVLRVATLTDMARSASGSVCSDDPRVRHRGDGSTRALHCRPDPRGSGTGSRRSGENGERETAAIHVAPLLCHLGGKVIQTPYGTSPPAARSEP